MRLADRMTSIGTESAFEAAARARALEATGRSVIHLEIGEPDFDTPAGVREAAKRAIDAGKTHYPPFPGIPELRAAIAEDTAARRGFAPDPANVFVTVGGKGVMYYAILALVNPGDEVIVPDPGYPIYESVTRFVGGDAGRRSRSARRTTSAWTPTSWPRWSRTADAADRHQLARQPHRRRADPRGPRADRGDRAARTTSAVLSDEIYSRILYDGGEHTSIAALPGMAERTIILDGFSKTYAMTGWRLGYGIVPADLAPGFGRLLDQLGVGCHDLRAARRGGGAERAAGRR